ncbi:type I restriction endonuclease subunit R [Deinococcus frigens]|uniref:type I restriction endonuclease subunit R n=1 Tax=Deinococcus frigens TaxID=249403 RepID=UPI0004958005|nr:type I restriction endonuclease subunit R [Deinococcus frigens]
MTFPDAPGRGKPEKQYVEDPAIATLETLGWRLTPLSDVQRVGPRSAILRDRLHAALSRLNPGLSPEALELAVRRVSARERLGLVEGNREVHGVLTHGFSVRLDDDPGGLPSRTVQLADFVDTSRNEYTLIRQFPVVGEGGRRIEFDLSLFVNGVLWAVLECKYARGDLGAALSEGHLQLSRYQSLADYVGRGAPSVFASVQVLGVLCGSEAVSLGVYGAVGASARAFAPFPEAYPQGAAWLADALGLPPGGQPNPQQILLYSVFAPENLLEFARSFTVYEVKDGRLIRKLARHQQRVAVDRVARRVLGLLPVGPEADPAMPAGDIGKGGIIWHTQGSGKSLTMVWLAQKLRQTELRQENPNIVVVTDRVSLDGQITGVFGEAGLTLPERARTTTELRKLLGATGGVTVMTTVQKFADFMKKPGRTSGRKVFVLVDEAHRTQYGDMAQEMRKALPGATFIAFTGTPIEKRNRSTMRVFGPYIHRYTMLEAVRDKATVPIYYESRDVGGMFLANRDIDEAMERFFPDLDERETAKRKHATLEAVAGATSRVSAIAEDIIKHFTRFIEPSGFKGQVVAASRENAVRYWKAIRDLQGPECTVVITTKANDEDQFAQFSRTAKELEKLTDDFANDPADSLKLLIVVDMLLTGFDAPLEQVMYLDRPLSQHTLLQAIARVNRTYEGKEAGFIMDYWGITQDLKEALKVFDEADVQGVMKPREDLRRELEIRHRRVMRLFGATRLTLDDALLMLDDAPTRQEFEVAYRQLAQTYNALLPEVNHDGIEADFKWLSVLRHRAAQRIDRAEAADYRDMGQKVRRLIDDVVVADSVEQVLPPIDILAPDFIQQANREAEDADSEKDLQALASEIAHQARHEITLKFPQNPAAYKTLRERLEEILEQQRLRRIDARQAVGQLKDVISSLQQITFGRAHSRLSADAEAVYGQLSLQGVADETLAGTLEETIKKLTVVDWSHKEDVQREMRRQIKRELRAAGVSAEVLEGLTAAIVDVARARFG